MASPQCEDGFTKIANELLEQFCRLNLNKYEWRVLLAVIRETYGWNRKSGPVSVSRLERLTGIGRMNVSRTKKSLIQKQIIIINGIGASINKNYEQWVSSKQTIPAIVWRDTRPKGSLQLNLPDSHHFRCEYCFKITKWEHINQHHIIPREAGGPDRVENKISLCIDCHKLIHDLMPPIVSLDDGKYYRSFIAQVSSKQTIWLSSIQTTKVSSNQRHNKERKKEEKEIRVEMPPWISIEAFESFQEMRKKIKKPMTKRAEQLVIKELGKLKEQGFNPNDVLDQSTRNDWQDVYPIKEKGNGNKKGDSAITRGLAAFLASEDEPGGN